MDDTGAPLNLPFPEIAVDPPNGAGQIATLAAALAAKMGMAKIATLTPTSNVIDFTSIPSGFTHLKLVGSLRSNGGAPGDIARIRFNNDSGAAKYQWIYHQAFFSQSAFNNPAYDESDSEIELGSIPNNAAAYVKDYELTIPNYESGAWKGVTGTAVGNGASNILHETHGGLWMDTAAITRITIASVSGLGAPSKLSLYGLL